MSEEARIERLAVPALDEVLGKRFPVLDDGFVRVMDYMGSDESIAQAARVSYGTGTRKVHEDRGLIRYLMRHRHTTPFEMCEIKLHVRVPMDCWRQWIRHRTANVNEYSTRYSIAIDRAQRTASDAWRQQASRNKQGSQGGIDGETGAELTQQEAALQQQARAVYAHRLDKGVAREQARKDLPLSTYTEAYWKIDLHNLLHFLSLRMDDHAQLEIREYANVIGSEFVRRWCPVVWEAFLEYIRGALILTARDAELLRAVIAGANDKAMELAKEFGWIDPEGRPTKNREGEEAEVKLSRLGASVPWSS